MHSDEHNNSNLKQRDQLDMMVQRDNKLHEEQWNELTMDLPDRQRTYKCNNEERSRNHCRRGKAIIITYSECVSVDLVIHHTKRMIYIVCSMSGSTIFVHIIS